MASVFTSFSYSSLTTNLKYTALGWLCPLINYGLGTNSKLRKIGDYTKMHLQDMHTGYTPVSPCTDVLNQSLEALLTHHWRHRMSWR